MQTLWRALEARDPPKQGRWRRLAAYVAGGLTALAGHGSQQALGVYADGRAMLSLYAPAIILAAALGGTGPGLAAAGLGAVLSVAQLGSRTLAPAMGLELSLYLILSAFGVGLIARLINVRRDSARMQDVLAGREAFLQSVLDTVPDAMIIMDHHGIIQSFSATAEQIFGWTGAEVVGRNVGVLMPSHHRNAHDGFVSNYLTTGERKIIGIGRVVTAVRKDGTSFPVELCVGEALASGQRFFTGFLRDLTAEENAKRRVQELQTELVHISRLSAMGEMATALAHELNQPLTAIANYLNAVQMMVKSGASPDVAASAISKAADQALRAGDIIRGLRDFVGQGESERRQEDIQALILEAAPLALVGAKERGVEVQFRLAPGLDPVLVDRVQVQQVLLNLIRNALEAMADSDTRSLVIATEREGPAYVRVSVLDTGSGLSPQVLERLFQPFVTTKPGAGMGVGLSICKTIVEAQGGRIWADADRPKGAAFHFTLPCSPIEELG